MGPNIDCDVEFLDITAGRDAALVGQLAGLVNDVYAVAEAGLWQDGMARTSADELAELIAARRIAVATARDGRLVGSVDIHRVADDTSEFSMLVAAPDRRSTGIGRALVDFAEQHSRERGLRAIQLQLLVPRGWRHPNKEFLSAWYGRIGYRVIGTRSVGDTHPHLAALLATPCEMEVREKPLRPDTTVAHGRP
jgi:GNAT superfamily N-acetyltransferase